MNQIYHFLNERLELNFENEINRGRLESEQMLVIKNGGKLGLENGDLKFFLNINTTKTLGVTNSSNPPRKLSPR